MARVKNYFLEESGGKRVVCIRRLVVVVVAVSAIVVMLSSWLAPKADNTYFRQSSGRLNSIEHKTGATKVSQTLKTLFDHGKRHANSRRHRRKIPIRYFAQQFIGKGQSVALAGTKYIGFLLDSIDTRTPAPVCVVIPRGDEALIDQATLCGAYAYSGRGATLNFHFSSVKEPNGKLRPISAIALNVEHYTPGITGDLFTGDGIKVASRIGLNLLSGMANVMTQKQSLGYSLNSVQAKPTLENGLLQGISRAAQDQLNTTHSNIDQVSPYVLIPRGREMIIELTKEFK